MWRTDANRGPHHLRKATPSRDVAKAIAKARLLNRKPSGSLALRNQLKRER